MVLLMGLMVAPSIGQVLPQPMAASPVNPPPATLPPGNAAATPAATTTPGTPATGGTGSAAPASGSATNTVSGTLGFGGYRGLMLNNGYCTFIDNCGIHRFVGNSCANPRGPMRAAMEIPPPGSTSGRTPLRRLGGYTGMDSPSYRSLRISLRGFPFSGLSGLPSMPGIGAPTPAPALGGNAAGTTPGGAPGAGNPPAGPQGGGAAQGANATTPAGGGNDRPAPVPLR